MHDIRSLAATLHRKGKSGKTIQRMLSTLRTFFRYLMREGLARDNPAMDIRAPKSGKRLPKALDADQVSHLLDAGTHSSEPLALRDQAMMELLYACGLRLAELLSLNLDSLDLRAGQLLVTGKGNKPASCRHRQTRPHRRAAGSRPAPCSSRTARKALFISKNGRRLSPPACSNG